MNTSSRNLPEPSIAFTVRDNQAIDADAALDFNPMGARMHIREVWGADEFCVTLGQDKLRVTFTVSFSYLHYMEQSLRAYRQRLEQRGLSQTGLSPETTEAEP